MPTTTFFFAVLLTSVGAGTVGAVLGLGGGILLVPILTIFFGGSALRDGRQHHLRDCDLYLALSMVLRGLGIHLL